LKLSKHSYKSELTVTLYIICFIPFLLLCTVLFMYIHHVNEAKIVSEASIIEQIETEKLKNNIAHSYDIIIDFISDKNIISVLESQSELSTIKIIDFVDLCRTKLSKDLNTTITIYTDNQNIPDTKYTIYTDKNTIEKKFSDNQEINCSVTNVDNQYWLNVYKFYYSNGTNSVFEIKTPLNTIFASRTSKSFQKTTLAYTSDKNTTFIYNNNDIPISSIENQKDFDALNRDYLVKEMTVSNINGKFILIRKGKFSFSASMILVILFVILLSFLIALLLQYLIRKLTAQLDDIVAKIHPDDIKSQNISTNKSNEFDVIQKRLNSLALSLKSENETILKLESDLLNQKISPHFLYNNLAAIKYCFPDRKLEQVVDTLIGFYRNIFHQQSCFSTLRQELEHCELYVRLLKFAYATEFEYYVDVDDDLKFYTVLTNILQPIIENSFLHAINKSPSADRKIISILAYQMNQDLYIEISNNCCTLDESDIESISSLPEKNKSSLYIVDTRLKMHYGTSYGLDRKVTNDTFTTIIHLPIHQGGNYERDCN